MTLLNAEKKTNVELSNRLVDQAEVCAEGVEGFATVGDVTSGVFELLDRFPHVLEPRHGSAVLCDDERKNHYRIPIRRKVLVVDGDFRSRPRSIWGVAWNVTEVTRLSM